MVLLSFILFFVGIIYFMVVFFSPKPMSRPNRVSKQNKKYSSLAQKSSYAATLSLLQEDISIEEENVFSVSPFHGTEDLFTASPASQDDYSMIFYSSENE